jgi:hypothetical protein
MSTEYRRASADAIARLNTLYTDSQRAPNGPSMTAYYRMLLLTGATPVAVQTTYSPKGMGGERAIIYVVQAEDGTLHEYPVTVGTDLSLSAPPAKWGTAERVPFGPVY